MRGVEIFGLPDWVCCASDYNNTWSSCESNPPIHLSDQYRYICLSKTLNHLICDIGLNAALLSQMPNSNNNCTVLSSSSNNFCRNVVFQSLTPTSDGSPHEFRVDDSSMKFRIGAIERKLCGCNCHRLIPSIISHTFLRLRKLTILLGNVSLLPCRRNSKSLRNGPPMTEQSSKTLIQWQPR